jgi:hypothetical protein
LHPDAHIAALDDILSAHAAELGDDFAGYRNHAHRVAQICAKLASADDDQCRKIVVAAAFHDIGIWTGRTFDYLPPSVRAAEAYLAATGRADSTPEIVEAIRQHHKLTPWRGDPAWIVEPFRRADWIDVSRGLLTFALPRGFLRELYARWPGAGFHRRLVTLELAHLRKDPLHPLPMFRL